MARARRRGDEPGRPDRPRPRRGAARAGLPILATHVDAFIGLRSAVHAVPYNEERHGDLDVPEVRHLDGGDRWVLLEVSGVDGALTIIAEASYARAWLGWTGGEEHAEGVRCPDCDELNLYRTIGGEVTAAPARAG